MRQQQFRLAIICGDRVPFPASWESASAFGASACPIRNQELQTWIRWSKMMIFQWDFGVCKAILPMALRMFPSCDDHMSSVQNPQYRLNSITQPTGFFCRSHCSKGCSWTWWSAAFHHWSAPQNHQLVHWNFKCWYKCENYLWITSKNSIP